MNYSLVVSDWDDTLTPLGSTIPERTRLTLDRIRADGITMAVASGRSQHGLQVQLNRNVIPLDGLYFISYNGGVTTQAWDGRVLRERRLHMDVAMRAAKACAEAGAAVMVHDGRRLLSDKPDSFAVRFEADSNDLEIVEIDSLQDLDFVPVKLLIGGEEGILTELAEDMRSRFKDEAEVELSATFLMELNAKSVNKGEALKELCEITGIPIKRSVVFGDNCNDVSMLRVGGHSVAVANAVPQAMAAADEVTASSTESGVADVLDRLFPAD